MDELLSHRTQMPMHRVQDGMQVEANAVYLIPPRKEMIISGGRLLLTDKDPKQALTLFAAKRRSNPAVAECRRPGLMHTARAPRAGDRPPENFPRWTTFPRKKFDIRAPAW